MFWKLLKICLEFGVCDIWFGSVECHLFSHLYFSQNQIIFVQVCSGFCCKFVFNAGTGAVTSNGGNFSPPSLMRSHLLETKREFTSKPPGSIFAHISYYLFYEVPLSKGGRDWLAFGEQNPLALEESVYLIFIYNVSPNTIVLLWFKQWPIGRLGWGCLVYTLYIVNKLSLLMCHTPVTLIKTMNVEIVVLNCQKCNQCLKAHKSLGLLF